MKKNTGRKRKTESHGIKKHEKKSTAKVQSFQPEPVSIPVWKMDQKTLKKHNSRKKKLPKETGIFRQEEYRNEEYRNDPEDGYRKKDPRREEQKVRKKYGIKISVRARIMLAVLAGMIILLFGGYEYIVHTYTIKTVYVEGNSHYTDKQIVDRVLKGRWGHNSIYLNFRYHHKEIANIPFVSALEVKIVTPDTVKITVYEKSLAGYVAYMGRYMYFDKDGNVVESSQEKFTDIPEVTGLSFDHVIMFEKLPVKNPKVFSEILDITQALVKYSLRADQIYFDSQEAITLYFEDIRVQIGDNKNIDDKLSEMQAILPKLKGQKGVLQMEDYNAGMKTVTFLSDTALSDMNSSSVSNGNP